MIGRWYAQLSAYDLDITYVSGKSQVTADPLSRILRATVISTAPRSSLLPTVACRLASLSHFGQRQAWRGAHETEGAWLHSLPAGVLNTEQPGWDNLKRMISRQWHGARLARNIPRSVWASHQRKDPWLGPIYDKLSAKASQAPPKSSSRLLAIAQSYRLRQGVLQYRPIRALGVRPIDEDWVVAVPTSLQAKVIEECHEDGVHGHLGVRKTVFAIRRRYFFRKLRAAVARYIRKCIPCIRAKSAVLPADLPRQPFLSTTPFQAIFVDLYSPGTVLESGYKYVLTVVDLCSRWVQFIPLRSKLASEVLVNLCRQWFHFHGIPEFILSDRGKEFMGVMSTVCALLGIKQIRTTPYHPQTNGLCEVQHKTLTRELRIRGQRSNAPSWADLLSEVQFAINISLADEAPHLSPFQLVFGRSPRLSAVDITFPSKSSVHAPVAQHLAAAHKEHVKHLTNMRFRAVENEIDRKESSRLRWDNARHLRPSPPLAKGMLLHLHQPSKTLKKLTYQWSAPDFLLVKLHPPTCTVRPLVSPRGRDGQSPKDMVVNISKVRSHGKPPSGFWIGCRVLRTFDGKPYVGTIDEISTDEGQVFFHVTYEDFDEEEIDQGEVVEHVCYHPELDAARHGLSSNPLPTEGSIVLYASNYQPRVGKVLEVHPSLSKSVVVQVWKPKQPRHGHPDLANARYRTLDSPENPDRLSISPAQIRIDNLRFNEDDRFDQQSHSLVQGVLKGWKARSRKR